MRQIFTCQISASVHLRKDEYTMLDDWWLESYSEMDWNTRVDINADGHTDRQKTELLYCISELQIRGVLKIIQR